MTQDKETDAERKKHAVDTHLEQEGVANAPQEYPVDHIRCHVGEGDNVAYDVTWYG